MSATAIWIGVAVYLLIAVTVAWLSRDESTNGRGVSMSGYFLGARRFGGFVSALSYSATTYSAFMMLGLAGLTYTAGVGAFGFEIVYFVGVSLVAVFGPRFWRVGRAYDFITPSEMLGHRYESRAVAASTALTNCLFLIPYAAVQLAGVGYLLAGMSNGAISFTTGTVFATVVALVFSYIAGMRSVMWTDALQAAFMLVSATAVAWLVVHHLGGPAAMFDQLAAVQGNVLTVPGPGFFSFATFLGLTLPWFFFSLSNPQVSQRLFMPKSLSALRRMLIGFLCFGLVYTLVSVTWGFGALLTLPGLPKADLATPSLLASDIIPPLLAEVVMIGILAAAISTIDSIMLTLSSMLSRDVYAHAAGHRDDVRQLRFGKWVLAVIAVLALMFAELQLNLIAVLSVAASTGLAVVVPAIIGAFFWRRGTAAGALASILGGSAVVLTMFATGMRPLGLSAGVWVLPVSIVLFVVVSLCTRAPRAVADEFMARACQNKQ
ncbi:sodium:solute symporter family protein [Castellaniella sp.]|uniref:sodium:solute symporter family protein n=1 Tax=Castellaniella sp. TaxID=1955812 RepID=UPI002AFE09BF|nr:sodium:solute symporter family protein [Castellaniella sp.]